MSTEGAPGLITSFWRLITFWRIRKALGLVRVANEQFTGSTEGIRDAFDLHAERIKTQYKELFDAVSEVGTVLEGHRQELQDLQKEEEQKIRQRDGALNYLEQAMAAQDEKGIAEHTAAAERFDRRIQEIDARQAELEALITELNGEFEEHKRTLTKIEAELKKLPAAKAQAIADFVSSSKLLEVRNRIKGLESMTESGPIAAVLDANRKLKAKAKLARDLDGASVEVQDEKYDAAGRSATSQDRIAQLLASRKAEREAKTGAIPAKPSEDRPSI